MKKVIYSFIFLFCAVLTLQAETMVVATYNSVSYTHLTMVDGCLDSRAGNQRYIAYLDYI